MLFLGYKIYLIWSQKSTYYTIYFIFLNYLHICTAIIISYESKCYKCADSMQMKTDYEIVLSGLCILINKISKTIKTFFVLEHCINKISHSHKASISSWISWFLEKNTCGISTGYQSNLYRMTPRNRATKERLTMTDFTSHLICCFTKLLYTKLMFLLKHFTVLL